MNSQIGTEPRGARPSIAAFVVCCNEERQIRRCLESLRWCDEILIVDSGSTDQTLAFCREFTPNILHRTWTGYRDQKAFALEQCKSEWVINLDADEEVSPELRMEIESRLSAPDLSNVSGFELSRVVVYLGTVWNKGGWFPEYRLRLLRRSAAQWGGEEPHERAVVRGEVERLRSPLYHYTHNGFEDHVTTLNRFSTIAAEGLFKRGVQVSATALVVRPLTRFFKFFVVRRGYREGLFGFIVGCLEALYVLLKYAKVWEMQRKSTIVSAKTSHGPAKQPR